MNYSTAVMLINPDIRAMKTIYEPDSSNPKSYTFKTIDKTLKVDDLVLVPSDTRFGFTVNKIVEADVDVDFDSSVQLKWIVDKIDLSKFEGILAMESEAIDIIKKGELRKRREDIKKNTLDAVTAGEIDKMKIANLSGNAIENGSKV